MTSRERRMDRASELLTAQERAVLVLRSWKEDRKEDSAWRSTMPSDQAPAFNRYIDLMNGVNRNLGLLVGFLHQDVEKLSLRLGWLATFALWQVQVSRLTDFIEYGTKEPVTESEYRELEAKAREELVPVDELAEVLTERHEGWTEADIDPERSAHYEPIVMPQAWERVQREKAREIAELASRGVLEGRNKRRSLRVQAGSFYQWLGEPVPVRTAAGREYEVLPDEQAGHVAGLRAERQQVMGVDDCAPTAPVVYLPPDVLARVVADDHGPSKLDETVVVLKGIVREGVQAQWGMLGAVEAVIGEVREAFDGEDPALPDVRDVFEQAKDRLTRMHEEAQRYAGPFELGEPAEDDVSSVRELLERGSA